MEILIGPIGTLIRIKGVAWSDRVAPTLLAEVSDNTPPCVVYEEESEDEKDNTTP